MINKLSMMMTMIIITTIIITACTIFQDVVNFKYKQKDLYKNII